MRRMMFCTVALISLGLPACASTGAGNQLVKYDRNVIDVQKVAIVNQWSLRTGAVVTWVNPPVIRVRANGGLSD